VTETVVDRVVCAMVVVKVATSSLQMPQVILWYPYVGVDFRDDPDMVLPPGEVFDHRGMLI
jgi:hypothetical protein